MAKSAFSGLLGGTEHTKLTRLKGRSMKGRYEKGKQVKKVNSPLYLLMVHHLTATERRLPNTNATIHQRNRRKDGYSLS